MQNIEKEIENCFYINKIKNAKISFLAGDASNRKYFNVTLSKKKLVLMYDDDNINLEKFIKVSKYLEKEVSVPKIIFNFYKHNILILEDFGDEKYGKILDNKNKKFLYLLATKTLIYLQKKKFKLPKYSDEIFLNESNLFFDWYLPFFKKKKFNKEQKKFNLIFPNFLKKLEILPKTFVHRDFHIDNLFFLSKRKAIFKCGLIDYQDALIGPCAYDLVSLTQDARVDVPEKLENFLIDYYLNENNLIDNKLFFSCYKILAIQRHLKVLGIFCRLLVRDKKDSYICHIPRVKKMLQSNLMFGDFKELKELLSPLID
ncbi:MAG: aminoglycoside phosphotransferase family protein [Alphaproteobacteria bacterium]